MGTAGRDRRGICVFVKKHIRISGVVKERVEWGEYISFVM